MSLALSHRLVRLRILNESQLIVICSGCDVKRWRPCLITGVIMIERCSSWALEPHIQVKFLYGFFTHFQGPCVEVGLSRITHFCLEVVTEIQALLSKRG